MTKTFLFVCVANSFRSQLAEALARHMGDAKRARFASAGTRPGSRVHPAVAPLLDEIGVPLVDARPKAMDMQEAADATALVTLCGPLDDACPGRVAKRAIGWDIPDPTWGTQDEMRAVRDDIARRIETLLSKHGVLARATSQ